MAKLWSECTPVEQEQRRVNFGDCNRDKKAEFDAHQAELIRRFQAGETLSVAAKREARRLLRTTP